MHKLGITMALTAVIAALGAVAATPAAAGTTVPVSMTLIEPLMAAGKQGCTVANGNCGSGEVRPFGRATETLEFGAGCDGNCALRTIHLAEGSIVVEETAANFSCPGPCGSHPGLADWFPFSLTLSGVVVGGTGIFEGATGTLTGTVKTAGWHAQIKLSGSITLAS